MCRQFLPVHSLLELDLKDVAISNEKNAPGQKPGVIVEITDLKRNFTRLYSDAGFQELAEIFALYLINYKDVSIFVHGTIIDPSVAIANTQKIPLSPIEDADGITFAVELQVIEWRGETKRALYLCNMEGFPLSQLDTRFHVGPFHFSAYLKSDYVTALHNDESLGVAELEPKLQAAAEEARVKIKEYFRERAAEQARLVVDEWKAEEIYPFKDEPTSSIERVERQVLTSLQ